MLALLHPMMPFVTEEIWSYHPARRGHLAVHQFPEADESLFDAEAEAEVGAGIELTRRLRAWRDLVEAPAAIVLPARAEGVEPQEFVGRLARFEFGEDGGEPVAAGRADQGPRLGSRSTPTRSAPGSRHGARSCAPRSPGPRANSATSASSPTRPAEVVEEEREKLERYRRRARGAVGIAATDPEAYLDSLEPIGWRLGLERMHRLNTLLGMPQHRFASIHVVGTNGKSSVTRMTAALLEAHGVAAGAMVSPHLRRWSERILIRGAETRAGGVRGRRRPSRRGRRGRRSQPRRRRDPVRGRDRGRLRRPGRRPGRRRRDRGRAGGRLDATNTIPSQVTVLTSVGLDHTEWLGDTEEEIAAEKLAVLRDHTTLVLGRVSGPVRELAERTAAERGAGAGDRARGPRRGTSAFGPAVGSSAATSPSRARRPRPFTARSTRRSSPPWRPG